MTQANRSPRVPDPGRGTNPRPCCRSRTVCPNMPVLNETHTPPGADVSTAPPTENSSGRRLFDASSRSVLALYSKTTDPPAEPFAATYRKRPRALTSLTKNPRLIVIVPTMAPDLALIIRTERRYPTAMSPLPSGVSPMNPAAFRADARVLDLTTASVEGFT